MVNWLNWVVFKNVKYDEKMTTAVWQNSPTCFLIHSAMSLFCRIRLSSSFAHRQQSNCMHWWWHQFDRPLIRQFVSSSRPLIPRSRHKKARTHGFLLSFPQFGQQPNSGNPCVHATLSVSTGQKVRKFLRNQSLTAPLLHRKGQFERWSDFGRGIKFQQCRDAGFLWTSLILINRQVLFLFPQRIFWIKEGIRGDFCFRILKPFLTATTESLKLYPKIGGGGSLFCCLDHTVLWFVSSGSATSTTTPVKQRTQTTLPIERRNWPLTPLRSAIEMIRCVSYPVQLLQEFNLGGGGGSIYLAEISRPSRGDSQFMGGSVFVGGSTLVGSIFWGGVYLKM